MLSEAVETALGTAEVAAKRIDEWRSHLLMLASGSLAEVLETSFLGREMRAAATVAAMAEIEALLRSMLVAIGQEVNLGQHPICDLRPCLRPLASHVVFESLINFRDLEKTWTHRLAVTNLSDSTEIAILPSRSRKGPQPPLDGRTIQPRHLALVWKVLGLADPVPKASVSASLKKLTQIRNDVAHREVPIQQVFSEAGRTASEIAKYLDDVSLLLLHIGNEWANYVRARTYLASAIA